MSVRRVVVPGLARLPAFSHATVAGDHVFVSGTVGTEGESLAIEGGIGPQTTRTLRNIERILAACGCGLSDVATVRVYLTDMTLFAEMNEAYLAVLGADPPARITVGCSALGPRGALVEMDCVAVRPS